MFEFDNFNYQYDIHWITKLHKYGGWQTWDTNIDCCCCFFVLANAHLLLFLDKWFVHIYLYK